MLARRKGWIVFLILMLAFIPTASSFYKGLPTLPDQVTQRIPEKIDGMTAIPTQRKAAKVIEAFGTGDWVERIYRSPDSTQMTLFVARGYDCRPFFHLPEYGILNRSWSEREALIDNWAVDDLRVAVHVLKLTGLNLDQKVYYILLYENQAIGNPYWFLIRNLPGMLLKKRSPYTLIFLSHDLRMEDEAIENRAKRLMLSVLKHF